MRITHKSNIDFVIGRDGQITCNSTWEILPDSDVLNDWPSFRAAAESWAGKIGDAFRVPTEDSTGYTSDSDYIVTEISFKSPARFIYEVTFTGKKKHAEAEMIDISESINNNLEKEQTAKWIVHGDNLDAWLPNIGDVLSWAGTLFLCDDIQKTKQASGEWEVTLKAKDMAVLMIGNPSFTRTVNYESKKTAKWRVDCDSYEAFIADNDIDKDASVWAGADYYVTNISSEPHGVLGYYVTLEAKHIAVREIEVLKRQSFAGYDTDTGEAKNDIVYSGKWQVHKDNREEFEELIGKSAADWAGDGYIVTGITPTKMSDTEYEYTLEAKNLNAVAGSPPEDDRSKLWARIDDYPGCADFKIDGPMSGWTTKDNKKIKIREAGGTWSAAEECPFIRTDEMPKKYYERVIGCLTITETTYKRINPLKILDKLKADYETNHIFDNEFNLPNSSWRVTKVEGEKILDDARNPWTKYTVVYMCAPFSWKWNPTYWGV